MSNDNRKEFHLDEDEQILINNLRAKAQADAARALADAKGAIMLEDITTEKLKDPEFATRVREQIIAHWK